jgi:hypothetical protein
MLEFLVTRLYVQDEPPDQMYREQTLARAISTFFLQNLLRGSFLFSQHFELFRVWRGGGLRGHRGSSFESIAFLRILATDSF